MNAVYKFSFFGIFSGIFKDEDDLQSTLRDMEAQFGDKVVWVVRYANG
jgi:hypothetical protein